MDNSASKKKNTSRGAKLLWLITALAVVIGLYCLLTNLDLSGSDDSDSGDSDADTSGVVAAFGEGNVSGFDITDSDGVEISLTKTDGVWQNADDGNFPLDQAYPEAMLSAVASITAARTLENVTDLNQYGLDSPALTITISGLDGGTILVGDESAITDGSYYMTFADRTDTVYLIDSTIPDAFGVALTDMLVYPSLPDMTDLVSLTAETAFDTQTINYFDDSTGLCYSTAFHWFMASGDGYLPLDTDLTGTLVEGITGLTWTSCAEYYTEISDSDTLDAYGLLHPAGRVTLTYQTVTTNEDGETAVGTNDLTLLLGNYTANSNSNSNSDGGCYAMVEGDTMICVISGDLADSLLLLSCDELRPASVCLMDWDTVESMDLSYEDNSHSVTFSVESVVNDDDTVDTADVYTDEDGSTLDADAVQSLLDLLYTLQASGDAGEGAEGREAEFSATFHRNTDDAWSEMTMTICLYNSSSCLVEFDGESRTLVSNSDVADLISAAEAVFG